MRRRRAPADSSLGRDPLLAEHPDQLVQLERDHVGGEVAERATRAGGPAAHQSAAEDPRRRPRERQGVQGANEPSNGTITVRVMTAHLSHHDGAAPPQPFGTTVADAGVSVMAGPQQPASRGPAGRRRESPRSR